MPTVVAFANMKGGVGKTTLCVNLAFELFRQGNRVLVVDNDPQFNATSALLKPKKYIDEVLNSESAGSVYDIYEKPPRIRGIRQAAPDPGDFVIGTWHLRGSSTATLDLIPSRIELYETLRNPSQKEYLLDNFLTRHATGYDFVFVDCPPTPSVLTLSAFAASDHILIPVCPDYFSTLGLPQFLGTLSDFKSDLVDRHNVEPLGVIFTNVDRRMDPDTVRSIGRVTDALSDFTVPVFDSRMSHFKVYQKTLWQSVPVQRISGTGTRGKSQATAELRAIGEELQQRITSPEAFEEE